MDFTNQRILIIGGTSGFGASVANSSLKAGAHVHVIGHDPIRLHKFLMSHPGIAGSSLDASCHRAVYTVPITQISVK